jgi:hypothetical protein
MQDQTIVQQLERLRAHIQAQGWALSETNILRDDGYSGANFHHLLSHSDAQGVTAVVVYPINALINSQFDEFKRYKKDYEEATGTEFPISFGQYTVCLRKRSVKKAKKLCSLSPPSGALRRIGAVANEERSGPQFD